ncbi:hypothetical protein AJ79_05918 [Helicocarpus griseus UAMH5409]|uniref:J domain-containing protein n=1 Tax=Helicocarpus griseus UAMH5409 TaxID=1447875 RepID=A0A2B7XJC7_9EURO|nr:hypothetical protein AJ79_05918 [Helicocarpus griseus UAMH5409]
MPSREDELLPEEPPSSINPYEVLGVAEDATADQIKSAYRKQALKHHPGTSNKAPPEFKESANKSFQEIAFAYAILSDPRRRRRYDATGNTSESLSLEDDDFNWIDFFREQFSTVVDVKAIDNLKAEYQGSQEERRDLLAAYEQCKGDMDRIHEEVMLASVLDDDERFRGIITEAIASGEVKDWPKFSQESEGKREKRMARARREAEEAEELAGELGLEEKLGKQRGKKKKGKGGAGGGDDLAALIQQRQKSRAATFLDDLEAKYASSGSKSGKGKKRKAEPESEPPEEAFQATANCKTAKEGTRTGTRRRTGKRGD